MNTFENVHLRCTPGLSPFQISKYAAGIVHKCFFGHTDVCMTTSLIVCRCVTVCRCGKQKNSEFSSSVKTTSLSVTSDFNVSRGGGKSRRTLRDMSSSPYFSRRSRDGIFLQSTVHHVMARPELLLGAISKFIGRLS